MHQLICQCGNNTHSVIQSALNKVRFNLGYVLPTTLVNRLTSLQQDAEVDYLGRTVEHQLSAANRDEARVMMDAWLKVRWNLIDRWQLMKMAKDDILSKVRHFHPRNGCRLLTHNIPYSYRRTCDQS